MSKHINKLVEEVHVLIRAEVKRQCDSKLERFEQEISELKKRIFQLESGNIKENK